MKRIATKICILLSALMLLTACHSTVPLDDPEETESKQPESDLPVESDPPAESFTDTESDTLPASSHSDSDTSDTTAPNPITDESVLWLDTDGIYPEDPPYSFFTNQEVLDTDTYLIGGVSIFASYQNEVKADTMLKYNTATGLFSPVCVDPYCDHLYELKLTSCIRSSTLP